MPKGSNNLRTQNHPQPDSLILWVCYGSPSKAQRCIMAPGPKGQRFGPLNQSAQRFPSPRSQPAAPIQPDTAHEPAPKALRLNEYRSVGKPESLILGHSGALGLRSWGSRKIVDGGRGGLALHHGLDRAKAQKFFVSNRYSTRPKGSITQLPK
jgi:hypothetical protein